MGESVNELVYLSADAFSIFTDMQVQCDIISDNIKRYKTILFPPKIKTSAPKAGANRTILTELIVFIEQNEECPQLPNTNMDESCRLIEDNS
jgi:hypothetical protein